MLIIASFTNITDIIVIFIELHFLWFYKYLLNKLLIWPTIFFLEDTLIRNSAAGTSCGSFGPLGNTLVTKLMITSKFTLSVIKLNQTYWTYFLIEFATFIFGFNICCFGFIKNVNCLCCIFHVGVAIWGLKFILG